MYTTYLELCNGLVAEAGISGELASVTGQTGEKARVVGWVRRACSLVEGKWGNWNFLHNFHTFSTVANVRDYPAPTNHNLWDTNSARIVTDESILFFERYTNAKRDATNPVTGSPYKFTVLPSQALRLFDTPDAVVEISIDYWQRPTVLQDNSDEPMIPVQYRDVIVYKALEFYATYENADELLLRAQTDMRDRMQQLEARELPATQGAGFLNDGPDVQVQVPYNRSYGEDRYY